MWVDAAPMVGYSAAGTASASAAAPMVQWKQKWRDPPPTSKKLAIDRSEILLLRRWVAHAVSLCENAKLDVAEGEATITRQYEADIARASAQRDTAIAMALEQHELAEQEANRIATAKWEQLHVDFDEEGIAVAQEHVDRVRAQLLEVECQGDGQAADAPPPYDFVEEDGGAAAAAPPDGDVRSFMADLQLEFDPLPFDDGDEEL